MAHSLMDLSSAGNASKDANQRLMAATRNFQRDEVELILQREHTSLSGTVLKEAVRCAVYFMNKDILLTLIRYDRCYCVSEGKFHLLVRDSLRPESNQSEIFWLFHTLYSERKDLAIAVAAAYPEETLSDKTIWPEVIPALDQFISKYFKCHTVRMSHLRARAGESNMTSLQQWCVKNGYVNMVFYLTVVTKVWEFAEMMMSTQTNLDVNPVLLFEFIRSMLDDTRTGSARGCSAAVAALKRYPLNDRTVRVFAEFPNGELVAKACEDEGLLDWALLFSSDPACFEQHGKNCQNQHVLNHVLVEATRMKKWKIVSELIPRCSDTGTLEFVLCCAFWWGGIYVAEETMHRVDTSAMYTEGFPLICIAVNSRNFHSEDTTRRLVRLCIASGLSTVHRSLSGQRCICYILSKTSIPTLWLMRLLVESGNFPHATLHKLSSEAQSVMSRQATEEEKKCLGYVQKAAATPCSLQHLARLVVSHSIGCQPGRAERIQALPLPELMKSYLRFADVLTADT